MIVAAHRIFHISVTECYTIDPQTYNHLFLFITFVSTNCDSYEKKRLPKTDPWS